MRRRHFQTPTIDLRAGPVARVSITYVDGPYTWISGDEQSVQAMAIARHVWRLAERPPGTETISVRIERPMQVLGDYARANEYFFYPEQLKGPE